MRFRGASEAAVVALAAAALTALLTYPIAFNLGHVGRVNTDDGRWSLWVVSWVAHALTTDPAGVFDANIFYPHRQTLAFSEANLGAGLAGVPAWLLTGNPYATHNSVVLLAFVLAAAGAYYLVRHLTGDRGAAAVAGVLFAFCPYIFARTAHIQLLLTAGLPFSLLAFHRVVERPTAARGATLGAVLWATALSCAYYGIFAALIVGLGTLTFGVTRELWRRRDFWGSIGIGAAVSVGLTLPFFLPYLDVQRDLGFERSLDEARQYSANVGAWLASAAWAHRWWLPAIGRFSEVLFPGVLATVLGAAGLIVAWRRAGNGSGRRDVAGFYALVGVLAFWASFGPAAGLYTAFYHAIPVFSFLRAPARFGIVVVLALTVLAGFALSALLARRPRGRLVAGALAVVAAAELLTAPLAGQREADPVPAAYDVLARLPYGPVAEFPFFYLRSDFPRHAYYMLQSTRHWQPLVNGYSDHIPDDFRDAVIPLSSFPTRESFGILGRIGARYVVFHLDFYNQRSRERLLARLEEFGAYLRPLHREGDVWLFEIVDWPN